MIWIWIVPHGSDPNDPKILAIGPRDCKMIQYMTQIRLHHHPSFHHPWVPVISFPSHVDIHLSTCLLTPSSLRKKTTSLTRRLRLSPSLPRSPLRSGPAPAPVGRGTEGREEPVRSGLFDDLGVGQVGSGPVRSGPVAETAE